MGGGAADWFGNMGGLIGGAFTNAQNRKAAKQDKRDRIAFTSSLDYEPMYASQTTPTYQQTQSPIARSYLESFLSGTNQNATFSGSPNAAAVKEGQQTRENAMFGTPEERAQKAQAARAATPWAVTPPTRSVVGDKSQAALQTAKTPRLVQEGLDGAMIQDLVSRGILKDGEDAITKKYPPGVLTNAYAAGDYDTIDALLNPYKGLKHQRGLRAGHYRRQHADYLGRLVDKYDGEG